MNVHWRSAALLVILVASGSPGRAAAQPPESQTFRLEWANDIVFHSDNLFTDGFDLQWHSRGWAEWDGEDVHALARAGGWLPGLGAEGLVRRHALSIGQHMQTPEDLSATVISRNDVAYAGALLGVSTWYAYDDRRFRGLELVLGVLGPGSGAADVQAAVHRATGSEVPQGWVNQLRNRPLLSVGYTLKQKLLEARAGGWQVDVAVDGQAYAGNLYALAGARAAVRLGYNLPGGFLYTPGKLGATMIHDATLPPPERDRSSVYLSLQAGGNIVFYNALIDDNELRSVLSVRKEPWIGRAALGLHWRLQAFAIHMTFVGTTGQVRPSTTRNPEVSDRYGDLSLELRI